MAAGVALLFTATLVLGEPLLLLPLAYGFVARVLAGPTFSPLARFVVGVVTPRLPVAAKPVAGPPKRFAQGIGAVLSTSAAVAHFAFGATGVAFVLVAMILAAATLEAAFAFCLGCRIFAVLMRLGMVSRAVCEECAVSDRPAT